MPRLGDFLGTLLAELVIGRAQADAQALAIAKQLYRGDELLRTFPVPRFRLPTVSIRVPVAVRGTQAPGFGAAGQPFAPADLRDAAMRVLDGEARRAGVTLPERQRKTIADEVDGAVKRLEGLGQPPGLHQIATELTAALTSGLGPKPSVPIKDFTPAVLSQLIQAQVPTPGLEVGVTAAELHEATHVMNLDLTIREEAVEWTAVDIEGSPRDRLVPE